MTAGQRFASHKSKAKRSGKSQFHLWLKDELEAGRIVRVKSLEKCHVDNMTDCEQKWIDSLKPEKNTNQAHDGGKKRSDIDWTPYIHLLGNDHDTAIAKIVGVTRKAVAYKRRVLGIPATTKPQRVVVVNKVAGWNKKELPSDCIELLGMKPEESHAGAFTGFFPGRCPCGRRHGRFCRF